MTPTDTKKKQPKGKALAALVEMPTQLPATSLGKRLEHLSFSSINKFYSCPEQWRRHYLLGERTPTNGNMLYGSVMHKVVEIGALAKRDGKKGLDKSSVDDVAETAFKALVAEAEKKGGGGVNLDGTGGNAATLDLCRKGSRVIAEELLPTLPTVIATEVKKSASIGEGIEWEIMGYLDLICEDKDGVLPMDIKTKIAGRSAGKAYDTSMQVDIYLLLLGLDADYGSQKIKRFQYIELLGETAQKPVRVQNYVTSRTPAQLKVTMLRIAQAAQQIDLLERTYGRDNPWPFARPDNFLCNAKFCGFYADGSCPVSGKGL